MKANEIRIGREMKTMHTASDKQLRSATIREMRDVMVWLTKGEVGMFCGGVTYMREGDANQRRTAKLVKVNAPANKTTGLALFKTRDEWKRNRRARLHKNDLTTNNAATDNTARQNRMTHLSEA